MTGLIRPEKQRLREAVEIASWDAWYFDFSEKKSGAGVGKAQWHSEILQ